MALSKSSNNNNEVHVHTANGADRVTPAGEDGTPNLKGFLPPPPPLFPMSPMVSSPLPSLSTSPKSKTKTILSGMIAQFKNLGLVL